MNTIHFSLSLKRLLLLFVFACSFYVNAGAQEVYTTIRSKAISIVNDPKTDGLLKELNQFKIDALDYMAIKMKEVMPDTTAIFLDQEAYGMNGFLNLYIKTILNCQKEPAAFQVKIIKLFMDASYSNPLFNDPDKELVLSYFADGKSMTRFSLDTDWLIAYMAAKTELEKIK